jgi:hypothetical protein
MAEPTRRPRTRSLLQRCDSVCATSPSCSGGGISVQLGELVAAAFDDAAQYSSDPREVSRLATETVAHLLRRARDTSRAPTRLRVVEAPRFG